MFCYTKVVKQYTILVRQYEDTEGKVPSCTQELLQAQHIASIPDLEYHGCTGDEAGNAGALLI